MTSCSRREAAGSAASLAAASWHERHSDPPRVLAPLLLALEPPEQTFEARRIAALGRPLEQGMDN